MTDDDDDKIGDHNRQGPRYRGEILTMCFYERIHIHAFLYTIELIHHWGPNTLVVQNLESLDLMAAEEPGMPG